MIKHYKCCNILLLEVSNQDDVKTFESIDSCFNLDVHALISVLNFTVNFDFGLDFPPPNHREIMDACYRYSFFFNNSISLNTYALYMIILFEIEVS